MTDFHRWISFTDPKTHAEAGVGVYPSDSGVRLVISHRLDGDLDATLPIATVRELIDALKMVIGEKPAG